MYDMRRKDRQMDRDFGLGVIDRSEYGMLAIGTEDVYNIPLSIVRIEDCLYFHSAKEGRKIEIFKDNPTVAVTFVTDVNVPENYTKDQLNEMKRDKTKGRDLVRNVFTTEFASTMVWGKVQLVEDHREKIEALKAICEKYTPSKMEYFTTAIEAGLSRVNIYRVKIERLSSKRKKYDENGIEL